MSLKRLCGKIATVTASTDGIGFAIAQRLAQEGAKVLVSSRKPENVEKAVKKLCEENLDVTGLACHVSKSEDRKKLFEELCKLGGLDILVSNAGINPEMCAVLDCSENAWDKIFEVNVKSAFLLAKESLPLLRNSKNGRMIFIASIAGFHLEQPFDQLGAYNVSKTALLGLTKAAALQLAKDNITVNSICPGIIQTKFSKAISSQDSLQHIPLKSYLSGQIYQVALLVQAIEHFSVTKIIAANDLRDCVGEPYQMMGAQFPTRVFGFGVPQEIGSVAAFLASSDAAYITGENIVVGGGMSSRL